MSNLALMILIVYCNISISINSQLHSIQDSLNPIKVTEYSHSNFSSAINSYVTNNTSASASAIIPPKVLFDPAISIGDNTADGANEVHGINSTIATERLPYLTMYGDHRAEISFAVLPKWLQTYFDWHSEQTRNSSNITKYVVLTCHGTKPCGGISDRLRPLPFYLLHASLVPRVLCIHWTKPFGLENYLTPPMYAAGRTVDWRCPADIPLDITRKFGNCQSVNCIEEDIKRMRSINDKYVSLYLGSNSEDRINYHNNLFQLHTYTHEAPIIIKWQFIDLTGDIFRVMFEPVLALTQSINDTMTSLGLKENEYASAHVRSRYPIKTALRKIDKQGGLDFGYWKEYLLPIINNAVSCANHIAMNSTIYFSSDNNEVVNDTITRDIPVGGGMQVRPVAMHRDKEPLHSDGINPESQISDFFPMIEDLLIMGGGSCVAHGVGSFGAFGAGLSGNRCRSIHRGPNVLACPNTRTEHGCESVTKFNKGKILFDSGLARHGLITSPRCYRTKVITDVESNHNKTGNV
eukprot:CAMPEP_0194361030 /NCGR_PEP_ID=MMETSP0174-20130528/8533_1 /TAXON_ID=216777 /ORGANISM="Proboscia alata, Strain PI-D3" /LENGTH=520 /DNA_ID=CAMNT_0039132961 /DNA_START=155 /DNA_END=1717 /DNA_ORIENTATION=+